MVGEWSTEIERRFSARLRAGEEKLCAGSSKRESWDCVGSGAGPVVGRLPCGRG